MPIKNLTDRGLAFPEIGHIRKGDKVEKKRRDGSTYEVPVDLDYFRVEFDEHEQEAQKRFEGVYGKKPQEINIILPFNDIDQMWDAWLEAYTAGRMIARSDREYIDYQVDGKTGEILVRNGIDLKTGIQKPHPDDNVAGVDSNNKPVEFSPVGRLKVIVPELGRAAYLTVHTGSWADIQNIDEQLKAFYTINNERIAGIPLVLRRRPKKVSTPTNGNKRVRMTKWMLSIEADPRWVRAKLSEVKMLALPGNGLDDREDEPEEEVVQGEAREIPNEQTQNEGPPPPENFEDEPGPEPEGNNPDPISDQAWEEWQKLVEQAKEKSIPVPNVNRERTTTTDLRPIYDELRKKVNK